MLDGKRVVVFTPWGREATASALCRYLARDHERGIVDEWQLWQNTDADQKMDRDYGYDLAKAEPWINCYERPNKEVLHPKQMNTGTFYAYTQDPDAIYVRMDDDIVWIEENAIARLVQQRIDNPMPFVVFPIIWNNAVSSYYLQANGKIPIGWGTVSNYCMDEVGWKDPEFAERMHNMLLEHIAGGTVDELFLHTSMQLPLGHQFSVSSFAQFGTEYRKFNGYLGGEEEAWHTVNQPWNQGRPNIIVPNSLVSHFSFYHQRDYLLNNTNLLQRYRELAALV